MCECVWDSRRGICTYMYMYMEARGQPWVLFLVVIHLVLCVCFYELVSHWLIWGMPIMTARLAGEPKRSSSLTSQPWDCKWLPPHPASPTVILEIKLRSSDHPASTLLTELSNPSTPIWPQHPVIILSCSNSCFLCIPPAPPYTVCMNYALFLTHGSRSIPFLVAMILRWAGIFLYSVTDSPSAHSMGLWLFRGASCLN